MLILAIAHLMIITPLMSERVSLSFEKVETQDGLIEVKLMMKSNSEESFSLGNQNFRIFYNADHMSLQETKLKNNLSSRKYTQPEIIEHEQYLGPLTSEGLSYASIGFLNFNVLLLDDNEGGKMIDNNWKHIYSLYFRTESEFENADITFANSDETSDLATAYVEISEWINPTKTKPMEITIEASQDVIMPYQVTDISVGPNPTADFVYIMSQKSLAFARIYTSNGTQVLTNSLDGNESKIDLSNLIEGLYFVEVEDQEGNIDVKEIIKY